MKLVLSGGGLHGASILGALDYLKLDRITHYFGTSVGSIISLLMNCGYEIREVRSIFEDARLVEGACPNVDLNRLLMTYGVYNMKLMFDVIENYVVDKIGFSPTLLELNRFTNVDLTITGTNVTKKRCEYFHHSTHPTMRVMDCVRISCAIPLLMESVRYNDSVYVDGGLLDNFPVRHACAANPQSDAVTGICIRFQFPPAPVNSFIDFVRELAMTCFVKVSDELVTSEADVYSIKPLTFVQLHEYATLTATTRATLFASLFEDGRLQAERMYLSKLVLNE